MRRPLEPGQAVCDVAAAELLIPEPYFCRQLVSVPLTFDHLLALSNRFLMSPDSVIRRVAEVLPGGRAALLKRRQSFTSARPLDVGLFNRWPRWLPDVIGERAFRPNLFSRASQQGGRAVTASLTVVTPGYRLPQLHAILLTNPNQTRTVSSATASSAPLYVRNSDFILLVQFPGASTSDLWDRIARRAPRSEPTKGSTQ